MHSRVYTGVSVYRPIHTCVYTYIYVCVCVCMCTCVFFVPGGGANRCPGRRGWWRRSLFRKKSNLRTAMLNGLLRWRGTSFKRPPYSSSQHTPPYSRERHTQRQQHTQETTIRILEDTPPYSPEHHTQESTILILSTHLHNKQSPISHILRSDIATSQVPRGGRHGKEGLASTCGRQALSRERVPGQIEGMIPREVEVESIIGREHHTSCQGPRCNSL